MDLLFKEQYKKYKTSVFSDTCEFKYHNYNPFENNIIDINTYERGTKRLQLFEDEKSFKENTKNLLAKLSIIERLVVVEKNDEKITLKYFHSFFGRPVFVKWFKKTKKMSFITYRFKDGAVFYGDLTNYHKKRKAVKTFRRFSFGSVDIINEFQSLSRRLGDMYQNTSNKYDNLKPIRVFVENIPGSEKYLHLPIKERFYATFLDKNKVKFPNNFMSFIGSTYGVFTKKNLKKYDQKMIDAAMSHYGLSGGKIKRVLHQVDSVITGLYFGLVFSYGEKFMLSQDDDFLIKVLSSKINGGVIKNIKNFSKSEKNKCFNIINLVVDGSIDEHTFYDHIKYLNFIKKYEEIQWKSQTYDEFRLEHEILSNKYYQYTNGVYKRNYSKEFINYIERTIMVGSTSYYPVVLLKSDDYNTESSVQSNCVRNYIRYAGSLIISLRKGELFSKERATIEVNISADDNDNLILMRTQTLGRFNYRLTNEWDAVLEEIDDRIKKIKEKNMFKTLEITATPKGGNPITSNYIIKREKSNFGENVTLSWEDPEVLYNFRIQHFELDFNELPI